MSSGPPPANTKQPSSPTTIPIAEEVRHVTDTELQAEDELLASIDRDQTAVVESPPVEAPVATPPVEEEEASNGEETKQVSTNTPNLLRSRWFSKISGVCFASGFLLGASILAISVCSSGLCSKHVRQVVVDGPVASTQNSSSLTTSDSSPWYKPIPLNTFNSREYWFLVAGNNSAIFPDIGDYDFCVAVCRSEGFDSGTFLPTQLEGVQCSCFRSDDITCLLEYGPNIDTTNVAEGTIFTPKALGWCPDGVDYCTVDRDSSLCLTVNQWSITDDVPWYGEGPWTNSYIDSSTVVSQFECREFCSTFFGMIHTPGGISGSSDNCFCFDEPTCMIELDADIDFDLAEGTFAAKRPVSQCDFTWCEESPTSARCYTRNKFSNSFQFNGTLTTSSNQGIDTTNDCLRFCAGHDAAVYYDNGFRSNDSCECYDNVRCLTPGSSKFTSLFTLESEFDC